MESRTKYNINENEFNKCWFKYVENFIATPSKELEAIKKGELLFAENRNILEHLLMARKLSEVITKLLNIESDESNEILSAATIHDAFVLDEKKYIREKTKAGIHTDFNDLVYVKSESSKKLRSLGFPESVIELTDENITHEVGGPKDLSSKIIFIIDAVLSGPKIVDVPERFKLTNKGWRSDYHRFDEETRLGTRKYYEEFFLNAPGHGNRPHDEVQLETAHNICVDLTKLLKEIDPETANPIHEYIFGETGNPDLLPYYFEYRLKTDMLTS